MDILWLWCNHKNVMQLLLRVCSVDRVRAIQCIMQLTAARFRYLLHLNSIAAPQMGMYLIARCHSRRKTYFAEYSQQSRSLSHWFFLWLILKNWLFKPALIYDCLVIRETRTTSKPEKIQTNRQWVIWFKLWSTHMKLWSTHMKHSSTQKTKADEALSHEALKKTKADGSRLIPRKHTETLVLLSMGNMILTQISAQATFKSYIIITST